MLLMFADSPVGTFASDVLEALAAEMTEDGEELEMAPVEPMQRSTPQVFYREYPASKTFTVVESRRAESARSRST